MVEVAAEGVPAEGMVVAGEQDERVPGLVEAPQPRQQVAVQPERFVF